jgi:hypothetical protein
VVVQGKGSRPIYREVIVAQKSFQDAMNENLQFIRRALHRIAVGEAPETELRNVRVYLMNTLDLIEPDSRITESADELSL